MQDGKCGPKLPPDTWDQLKSTYKQKPNILSGLEVEKAGMKARKLKKSLVYF
jgi:hypothetical protein